MSSSSSEQPAGSNTAVTARHDHDRVQMLSVRADGTPDQYDPEFIGDKDSSLQATREQFKQQAVSAADTDLRANQGAVVGYSVDDAPQDPTVEKLQQAHEEVAKEAEQAAEAAVESLTYEGEETPESVVDEPVDPSPEERRERMDEAASDDDDS